MLKAIEYLSCLAFLALFAGFWTYAQGTAPSRAAKEARAAAWSGQLSEWFRLPEHVFFHPGHGWAKSETPAIATVGLDDFAQQLVGPLVGVDLPPRGAWVQAGKPAWRLRANSKSVDMVAPVTGVVVAVNELVGAKPDVVNDDPYGRGWLFAVKLLHPADAFRDLVTGRTARDWMTQVSKDLELSFTPELGHLCQDGGIPVHGFARAIDEEHWDQVARKFLRS
jgi:glycine cleavage system H protein